MGKIVLFAGRKSLKVRNKVLADVSVPLSVFGGRIVAWDGGGMCGDGADGAENDVCQGGAGSDHQEADKGKGPCGGG